MPRSKELLELFDRWKTHSNDDTKSFITDGIIDESLYEQEETKILFIGKEVNMKGDGKIDLDCCAELREELNYRYNHRIADWAYGIQNKFPEYDSIQKDEKHAAIKRVAILELNKTGGKGKSEHLRLLNIVTKDLDFIKRQIEIMSPDIIVSGLYNNELLNAIFPGVEFQKSGYNIEIARYENYKVINFYHPSNQSSSAALYCLLEKVYFSKQFTEL